MYRYLVLKAPVITELVCYDFYDILETLVGLKHNLSSFYDTGGRH
jgi:hypothetical protein